MGKLEAVQTRIREHFNAMGGKLKGFGGIQQYRFADSFDTSVVLDITGNVIAREGDGGVPQGTCRGDL